MALKKLFNIRIDDHLHAAFKKFCEENDHQMTELVVGYIQDVVDGKRDAIARDNSKMSSYDPLEEIRRQYDGWDRH